MESKAWGHIGKVRYRAKKVKEINWHDFFKGDTIEFEPDDKIGIGGEKGFGALNRYHYEAIISYRMLLKK